MLDDAPPSPADRSSTDRPETSPQGANAQRTAARQLIEQARQALGRGDRVAARRLARQAAAQAPDLEDAWLLLAVMASPRASLAYLQHALQINPESRRARAGMHWAIARQRQSRAAGPETRVRRIFPPGQASVHQAGQPPTLARGWRMPRGMQSAAPTPSTVARRRIPARDFGFLLAVGILFLAGFVAYRAWEPVTGAPLAGAFNQANRYAIGLIFTDTPTVTASSTATPTPIPTVTPAPTATATQTPRPTATATATDTSTPLPSFTPTATAIPPTPAPTKRPKPKKVAGPGSLPGAISSGERWIDVDLSSQTTFAMQGDQVVNSFVVSTGLWPNLTVTGVYRIYVKYHTADMYGADYYLSGVPYVMYFYEGYGLHGTYWHNNFGSPMSHGCVNLRPADAGWLFDFAEVGTIVSVHE